MREVAVGLGIVSTLLLVGCAEPPASAEVDFDEDAVSHVEQLDTEALDRLRALPYLSSAPASDPSLTGVTAHDAERSQPGYNLYTIRNARVAELIDANGAVVNRWEGDGEGH